MQWTLSNEVKVTMAGKFALVENINVSSYIYELSSPNRWKKIFPKLIYGDRANNFNLYDALSYATSFGPNDDLRSEALCSLYNKYLEEVMVNDIMKN